jgi:NAD-dependent dihydropyrimidine dehydrogenase PreA subunit
MAKRITVVVSQGQSLNPAKRKLEEDLVAELMFQGGFDVTVVPHLYDLAPDGTGMLCLQGIAGDMVVLSWLYSRAAHWTLDRNNIRGQVGVSLLKSPDDDSDADDANDANEESGKRANAEASDAADATASAADAKARVVDQRPLPKRKIYCLDLRMYPTTKPYFDEIRRIADEATVQTVDLLSWIGGAPQAKPLDRFLNPTAGADASPGGPLGLQSLPQPSPTESSGAHEGGSAASTQPTVISEQPARRWYPVIDYARCTNCMECIDFCLFGVYGVDRVDTILVEQPDNCRKGCPACSRVCPENAIIFPQHKSPGIAGSEEVVGSLKIDLSALFGGGEGKDALSTAVSERDEQLLLAGRDAVGATVGVPKRQAGKDRGPKDDLDALMDQLDELEL